MPVIAASTPVAVLPRGDRGGADRAQVPHAGLPALRRVPRQRLRAVADPGRRRRCRDISVEFATAPNDGDAFQPYLRDPETLARPWAIPGTPGSSTGSAGSRRRTCTGNISYDPDNHDLMVRLRAQKVAGIAADIPELEVDDPDGDARTLVLGWGSTYGPIGAAVRRVRRDGHERRQRAPAPPQPVPAQHRRRAAPLREGARAGDEPRAAAEADPRRVPRRRGRLQPGARPAVPARASWRRRSRRWWSHERSGNGDGGSSS